uniref:Uncharacterized protein n=1 Tax=Spironucleus salmonicida TaxID=348837 RepID=V6LE41_9EUKA|eukprot:EST42737.1 hypothetical protein SS50377_17658 [Spironucleus salmonicida]
MRKTAQFYKSDEQNQNQLDEGAITYSAVIKPIDFDFVLFDELVNINNNFSVDRSSIRNTQVFNKSKAINHITPQLLFQSNQQNQNIFPSLTSAMNAEAIKVVRHAVPRSTLQNLDNTAKLTEKTKKTEEQMYYQAKNRQNAKIYDLDDVQEPSVKYTQIQFEEKKEVKKTKKSYKYEDMVQSDIEAYKQQPPPDAQDNSLRLTQLDTPKIDQKTNSMTIDNTFIIRLPPKYHKFGPQDTHIQQVIQNEVATNNDIIINIHDENYETIINSAISSVKTTHSQKIYKPLPQIKSVQSQEKPQTDAIETLKSHPLRITNQKIHVASVSPPAGTLSPDLLRPCPCGLPQLYCRLRVPQGRPGALRLCEEEEPAPGGQGGQRRRQLQSEHSRGECGKEDAKRCLDRPKCHLPGPGRPANQQEHLHRRLQSQEGGPEAAGEGREDGTEGRQLRTGDPEDAVPGPVPEGAQHPRRSTQQGRRPGGRGPEEITGILDLNQF